MVRLKCVCKQAHTHSVTAIVVPPSTCNSMAVCVQDNAMLAQLLNVGGSYVQGRCVFVNKTLTVHRIFESPNTCNVLMDHDTWLFNYGMSVKCVNTSFNSPARSRTSLYLQRYGRVTWTALCSHNYGTFV